MNQCADKAPPSGVRSPRKAVAFMKQILTVRRLRNLLLLVLSLGLMTPVGFAQLQPVEPAREELLNGLRVLIWSRPGSQELAVKLRIHSGAAFDLAGKSGGMTLLSDMLFPDPATVEFFTEEMNGKLDVDTDLDMMTITMLGRANEFERIVEILRNALVNTQFTPDLVARQKERRLKIVRETAISPAMVADRAIATRLFGDHPYGRPPSGTAEDLARVERADLMMARERFLNSNNATLTIVGGVEKNRTMRALRQLLGPWHKSEQIVPATFRQPLTPDQRTLIINGPADQTAEVRIAVRGFSRADSDSTAANALALVARQRWLAQMPELSVKPFFVRHESHVLPGSFVMGASVDAKSTAAAIESAKKVIASLTQAPVTDGELAQARNELIAQFSNSLSKPETMTDNWLDTDTFKLPPVADRIKALNNMSASDVQRAANRLFPNAPVASVILGDAQQLKAQTGGRIPTEVMGEVPKTNPNQPETRSAPKPNTSTKP
jgi:zinc protease